MYYPTSNIAFDSSSDKTTGEILGGEIQTHYKPEKTADGKIRIKHTGGDLVDKLQGIDGAHENAPHFHKTYFTEGGVCMQREWKINKNQAEKYSEPVCK